MDNLKNVIEKMLLYGGGLFTKKYLGEGLCLFECDNKLV